MHRTEVLLDDHQYRILETLAAGEGQSVSQLVRRAIDRFLASDDRPQPSRLRSIAGIGADPEVRGRDHDHWLYRATGDDER